SADVEIDFEIASGNFLPAQNMPDHECPTRKSTSKADKCPPTKADRFKTASREKLQRQTSSSKLDFSASRDGGTGRRSGLKRLRCDFSSLRLSAIFPFDYNDLSRRSRTSWRVDLCGFVRSRSGLSVTKRLRCPWIPLL